MAIALVGLSLSEAGPADQPERRATDRSFAAAETRKAAATISGQAFVIDLRGSVIYAARARVSLVPMTPQTTRWYEQVGRSGQRLPSAALHFTPLARTISTDEEGRFEFSGLRAGDYYIVSHLTAGVHTGYAMLPGGIILHNTAHVEAGESQKINLTAQVQPGIGWH